MAAFLKSHPPATRYRDKEIGSHKPLFQLFLTFITRHLSLWVTCPIDENIQQIYCQTCLVSLDFATLSAPESQHLPGKRRIDLPEDRFILSNY